jgi:hypothetical protein
VEARYFGDPGQIGGTIANYQFCDLTLYQNLVSYELPP